MADDDPPSTGARPRIVFLDAHGREQADPGPAPRPPSVVATLLRRRGVRLLLTALLLLVALVAAVTVTLRHRHEQAAQRRAQQAAMVATVRLWASDTTPYAIDTVGTTAPAACRNVDDQAADPPQERWARTLERGLPGFGVTGVRRTVDAAGRLCMLQLVLRPRPHGGPADPSDFTTVVAHVESPVDRPIAAPAGRTVTDSVDEDENSAGYAAAGARDGWVVVVGWVGRDDSAPATSVLRRLAGAEATRW